MLDTERLARRSKHPKISESDFLSLQRAQSKIVNYDGIIARP